jgi:DNA-binding response OmpR family regulator
MNDRLLMTKSILIIDDEEDIKAIAKMGLEMAASWQVITADSGREGLTKAIAHQPDAILLDLMMPDWDGTETLKQLKNNQDTANIPVILMTAKTQQAIAAELVDLELAGIITKPFRPLQLPEQIEKILNQ